MSGVWDKVTSVFFQEEEEEALKPEEMDKIAATAEKDIWQEQDAKKARRNQVMAIPGGNTAAGGKKACEMVLVKAKAYDDLQHIAQNIKEQKVVIVNFEELDKETAQRMVDFLSGAVFALSGESKKVSGSTFLFGSSQVDVNGQIMDPEVQAFSSVEANSYPWQR
ncbi:MAG: cell division protein SepF [Firmicutes bacterium]|nr:cell division protein SepF [Bacillota bacterium]